MQWKTGGVLAWLGLAACGGGVPADEAQVPAPEQEQPAADVSAQACSVGVAARVKIVQSAAVQGANLGTFTPLSDMVDVQGTLYFTTQATAGITLWRSNGTDVGTVPVKTFQGLTAAVSGLTAAGSKVFFKAFDVASGLELWVSDGTAAGTKLVKDLTPGLDGSTLLNAAEVNGQLLFYRLTSALKTELWRTDGTGLGTIKLGEFDGLSGLVSSLVMKVNSKLLFVQSLASGTGLWGSDGTPGGTVQLLKLDNSAAHLEQVVQSGSQAVFLLKDGLLHEIWKTDGTPGGTVRLDSLGSAVQLLGIVGSNVHLATLDPLTNQLRVVRMSLVTGARSTIATISNPVGTVAPTIQRTVTVGSQVLFSVAHGGLTPIPEQVALWVTNGTAEGTRQLFQPLLRSDLFTSPLFSTGEGKLLFINGNTLDPWFADLATGAAGRLTSLPASVLPKVGDFVRSGNRVYFSALDETGLHQLWSVAANFSCPAGLQAE
ncbi:hypothetical protein LXT21_05495 [Myxococcus sp. K38C18041901]|uniref:hypothetical protein n=1 Tax=Myxococcus guangdongensis TaxID=2906760 RepID=UPI0020A7EA18|nr:hypothetical protein [Myxococcus guangdongensis]MCP3058214.1 hypothetical protein [Myxococcus guangdongensis]